MHKLLYLQGYLFKTITMKTLIFTKLLLLIFLVNASAQTSWNWRGPERMGIYHEKGLMQEWPAGGPEMLWAYEKLGKGFSSPVIANGKIYITGMEEETGFVYILSMNGSLENKFPIGPEHPGDGYPGSRSAPAVIDGLIYAVSSQGYMVCMDDNGKVKWQRRLFSDFDGVNIRWGYTENLLVAGDTIYCAPGGTKHNIVALNRHDGRLIWASPGSGGTSAYCSPLLIDHNGRKLLVTMMQNDIVGLDANTGKFLWSYPHKNRWDVHPNTPVYHDGGIYAFSGYGKGGVKLKLNGPGDKITEAWINEDLDNQIGGTVLVDGYIYGAGDRNRFWLAVDWETGETVSSMRDIAKGTVIYADGRLYSYSERGELALLEPASGEIIIRGMTNVTLGSDQHWAHLVIHNGILYVRHGNALMAYNIKK
jgi:outer membrane protein assembly factor BamB